MSQSEPARQHLHPSDTAPGDERLDREEIAEGIKSYLIGVALAALLTVVSFFISGTTLVWGPSIPVALASQSAGKRSSGPASARHGTTRTARA
jgi:hypothetical protein